MSVIEQSNSAATTPLSIVHLNAYDHHGGAERVAWNLIEEQRAAGHNSIALVGTKTDPDSPAIAFETDPDPALREEFQRSGWPDHEFRGSHRLVRHPAVQQADVIHAHNLYGGFFHPLSLVALSQFRPVVWSIHDMHALTGYCSHALDCPRWEFGCGECPDLTRPGPQLAFDNTAALWQSKKLIAENSRLWIAGASSWMVARLQRSLLKNHPTRLIPNGIQTELFRTADRRAVRQKIGLPADGLIVGSLARTGVLSHPLKGGEHVRATLQALRQEHPEMLFLNIGSSEAATESWVRSIAPPSSELVREALSAVDIFLYPSIADTAPLAVIEAMACALPVVGFRIGGLPDFITESEGFLVPPSDTAALIKAVRKLATDESLRARMGAAARERAVRYFDRARMAEAYEDFYREAIAGHGGKSEGAASAGLEEIRMLQGKMLGLESKLSEWRARREKDDGQVAELLRNRWVRFGMWLGAVRGVAKDWLRLKEREQVKKQTREG